MDEKLKSTLDKICQLTQQNAEFDAELRKRLKVVSANSVYIDNERFNHIYEYCIEDVIHSQAIDFYNDFPIPEIKPQLQLDFERMELFRRKNNFGDFCLSLYQQIEGITNFVCNDNDFMLVAEKMWPYPAYIKNKEPFKISDRVYRDDNSCYAIAHLLFYGKNEKGQPLCLEKSNIHLNKQQAIDKIRNVVYFIGYKAEMVSWMYNGFNEICNLLYELYQCRNLNHRGTPQSEKSQGVVDKIKPLKSLYYFKFYGLLVQYVEFIKSGFPLSHTIIDYANNLSSISVPVPKQEIKPVGFIQPDELARTTKKKN